MANWKEWKDNALKSFLRGMSGEDPPVEHVGGKYMLLLLRDIIVAGIEIVLTGAAVFVYILISSPVVKVLLAISIVVSLIRCYATCERLVNTFFRKNTPTI